jgi:hypothetical protein
VQDRIWRRVLAKMPPVAENPACKVRRKAL